MNLQAAITQYVGVKQSLGAKFASDTRILRSFVRAHGHKDLNDISAEEVKKFLDGKGPPTRWWHRRYDALSGFYRFVTARKHCHCSPLPKHIPKLRNEFDPYIYSPADLRRLRDAIPACLEGGEEHIDPATYHVLLLLLYGAALRIGEAVALTLVDVGWETAVLTIRDGKFYRSRLVPIGAALVQVLRAHVEKRRAQGADSEAPLFVRITNDPLPRANAEDAFRRLRLQANVLRHDGSRYQPRLHDLRHTSATYRLASWYAKGADVQRLLPHLATYLGHIHIAGTQRYLKLVPQILQKAGERFERYALGGRHD